METLETLKTFITAQDFFTIFFLIFLEGILSIDNAVVLALLAKDLPVNQQKKALTYGLVGAIFFRFVSLFFVASIIKWRWVKWVGGSYLLFLSLKYFYTKFTKVKVSPNKNRNTSHFWKTVFIIELTDIAFALDSILAAVALSSKFWVVFVGGSAGVIIMRFAATLFIKLLKKFPNFENSAYLLVLLIGFKITLEGFDIAGLDFNHFENPETLIFWLLMIVSVLFGFKKPRQNHLHK